MRWMTLNGIYPIHPLWENFLLVLAFEFMVVAIETIIIISIHKKHPKFPLYTTILVANLITFAIGALIQFIVMWG